MDVAHPHTSAATASDFTAAEIAFRVPWIRGLPTTFAAVWAPHCCGRFTVGGINAGTMIKRPKIAIVGAGGNVGAAVAQWAVQKELGDLVLIDIKAGPAEGRALDLTQCGPWEGFNNTRFVATDKPEGERYA